MIKLIKGGVYYMEDKLFKESAAFMVESKKLKAVRAPWHIKYSRRTTRATTKTLK